MKTILVTGGKGQLASCIKDIDATVKGYDFMYVDVAELDITQPEQVHAFFNGQSIGYCINCAAYTAVDTAESNQQLAKRVNVDGAKVLAEACKEHGAALIHISTDFVFDGNQTRLYTEQDQENPLGVYGRTKLDGEKAIAEILPQHYVIRTSWLYSEHGHNFLKTMLRLGSERDSLGVVCDQIGTPTYARDLAKLLLELITRDNVEYGTYHYSNEGVSSWYDFAKAIFDERKIQVALSPIKTEAYPTPAERPRFSVMDKTKVKDKLQIQIPYWRDSLKECLARLTD